VKNAEARIEFAFSGKVKDEAYTSTYVRKEQAWTGRPGRPANPGLVLYAMSDGSFAVWDPARNYWQMQDGVDVQDRPPAYVFSPTEVWDGLRGNGATWLCNGLIRDWAKWQVGKSEPYKALRDVLRALSPSKSERLTPGDLTRISLDDVRDIPTVRMPYGQDVPVVNASSGIRRIIALAYFLVWSWEEHRRAGTADWRKGNSANCLSDRRSGVSPAPQLAAIDYPGVAEGHEPTGKVRNHSVNHGNTFPADHGVG
jgi:hypothetical protein